MRWLIPVALLTTAAAPASDGALSARPGAAAVQPVERGRVVHLAAGVDFYLPPTAPATRAIPLLVVLPGTGGTGRTLVDLLKPAADAESFALLGLTPGQRGNFDTIDRFFDDREAGRRAAFAAWPEPVFGGDAARLDHALKAAFERVAVSRVGLFGYSHGASYALSIGLANKTLFPTIAALSPGLLLLPPGAAGGQRVFLAHGKLDQSQPYRRTACAMAPKLKQLGYDVRFLPREGAHTMDEAELHAALGHFLSGGNSGPTAPPPGC